MANAEYSPALMKEIERYLQTGDHDLYYRAWPEGGMLHRAQMIDAVLRKALITRVHHRAREASKRLTIPDMDFTALARSKVIPMIHGLFPKAEREVVVGVLEKSVVFLTPDSVEGILDKVSFLSTAWDLSNLYLTSIGAPCLSEEAIQLDGLSQETTCFVSMRYFSQSDRFADFIVHEAAHIFHNCKRETIGLPHTRTREWLSEIDFRKRETFAYACNAMRLAFLVMSLIGLSFVLTLDQSSPDKLLALPWGVALIWTLYIAIEPHVRRRWPQILVGRTRLLSGDWKDPLVARDILIGCAFGVLVRSVDSLGFYIIPPWFGHTEQGSFLFPLRSVLGIRYFMSELPNAIWWGLWINLAIICFLLIITVLLRNQKIAMAACVLVQASLLGMYVNGNAWTFAASIVEGILIILLLKRFGFLAGIFGFFIAIDIFALFPITYEITWYAGYGFAALAVLMAIVLYAFRASLGGRPIFGTPRFDD